MVFRHLVEADRLQDRLAVDQRTRGRAERQSDPGVALVLLAVALRQRQPAAVPLADIVGDVGQLDQLVDIDVRRIGEADDNIGAGTGIRGHRGLLVDVLPADEVDLDLDPGLLGEFGRIGAEHILVGLDETHRSQHAQGCAFFDRQFRCGDVRGLDRGLRMCRSTGGRDCRSGQAQRQGITTCDVVPHRFLPICFPSRR
jgi:hypothetical protein